MLASTARSLSQAMKASNMALVDLPGTVDATEEIFMAGVLEDLFQALYFPGAPGDLVLL